MIVDLEIDDKKLDKFKAYIGKFVPYRLTIDYNTVKSTIDNVEEIDSINIIDMFDEFIEQLKLEDVQKTRIDSIIKELHSKNK
jgi:uncharacterized ubiquitin-like protein YukD